MAARRKVRLIDVARDAGVSPATVSRALAQPELLAAHTLDKVHESARKLAHRPNGMARALASGRSMTVGAIVPTLDSAIFAQVLQVMQSALAKDGYQLLVASHELNPAAETEAVRTLLARGVDGLMLVGAERAFETAQVLATAEAPVVLTWCASPGIASVTVDNHRAGQLAAQHLLDLGHRRIGMIVGHLHFNDRQRARLAGARAALKAAALDMPDWLVSEQPLTFAGGRTGCAELLELDERPTALIGGIDVFAIGCIQEAQARGIAVPEMLSVVGIDDIDMSAHMSPSLTTVHIPTTQIGQEAARSSVARIEGEGEISQIELPVELVVRRSSTHAPVGGAPGRNSQT